MPRVWCHKFKLLLFSSFLQGGNKLKKLFGKEKEKEVSYNQADRSTPLSTILCSLLCTTPALCCRARGEDLAHFY